MNVLEPNTKNATDQRIVEEIAHVSPEGRPGDPHMGPRRIKTLLAVLMAAIVVIGVVVAITVDQALGIGMAVVGVIIFLGQPNVLAALFRAQERKQVAGVEPPPAAPPKV